MKTTQPPIANDEELAGYRAGAEQLRRMIEQHEDDLMAERQRLPADLQRIDQIRYQVNHLYGYYRGIQDAIDAYLQRRQTA
jgi:Mg2+ and Co2+ transporter CorA